MATSRLFFKLICTKVVDTDKLEGGGYGHVQHPLDIEKNFILFYIFMHPYKNVILYGLPEQKLWFYPHQPLSHKEKSWDHYYQVNGNLS